MSPTSTPLVFDDHKIYGATWNSFGASPAHQLDGVGNIFSINFDGSDYQTLRNLGKTAISSLAVKDGIIYGLEDIAEGTQIGPNGPLPRNLFSMNVDGSEYQVLHQFQGGSHDGQNATRIVVAGQQLFGTTRTGGSKNAGTLFRSDLNGENYQIIHHFGPGTANGIFPNSDLVVIGSRLFGSTLEGGGLDHTQPGSGGGIVYSLPVETNAVPEPTSVVTWHTLLVTVACWKGWKSWLSGEKACETIRFTD